MTSNKDPDWTFHSIARVRSPLKEKFGLPRQPALVPQLKAQIEILPPYDRDEAFKDLAGFSHIWLVGVFHQALREQWQATVRPPRLGGNVRVGVFATRAPFRPNPIALSLCALDGIRRHEGRLQLLVSGCDLVDGTPVIDIKPYLPYADSVDSARAGFSVRDAGVCLNLHWSPQAQRQAQNWQAHYPDLVELVEALVRQDPRPAYQKGMTTQEYGMRIYECNIRFTVHDTEATIVAIESA